jgi:hypothetical protein
MSDVQIEHADVTTLPLETWEGFAAIITDPPYSDHVHANPVSCAATGGESLGVVARPLGFDAITPALRAYIAAAAARVERWAVVFSDLEGCHEWRAAMAAARLEYCRQVPALTDDDFELPWCRWSQPQLTGDRPPSGAEAVLHFHRQHVGPRGGTRSVAKHWNGPGNLVAYDRRSLRGEDKHRAEKPLDLMLDLVSWYTDPGEAVADLCAGAGTTALACLVLERDCLAVEQDERWAAHARARVSKGRGLSPRDRLRVADWCESTTAEAERLLASASATEGGRVRARARLADVACARRWL